MSKSKNFVISKNYLPEMDEGEHYRARLGFILMSTDLASESDFFEMAPEGAGARHARCLQTCGPELFPLLLTHFHRHLAVDLCVLGDVEDLLVGIGFGRRRWGPRRVPTSEDGCGGTNVYSTHAKGLLTALALPLAATA